MIFLGRRLRTLAFLSIVAMQVGIALTANYTFLNYNTIALALFLLNDRMIQRGVPLTIPSRSSPLSLPVWRRIGSGALLTTHFTLATIWLSAVLGFPVGRLPGWALRSLELAEPFRSTNSYGLFAIMTHERNEIEFEGSDDRGVTWRTYEFKWQPQRLNVAPF